MTPHRVLIALGSNHRQPVFIQWASQRMAVLLDNPQYSDTMWTKDIKGSGHMYMNRLVAGTTQLSVSEIEQTLKQIEAEAHRTSKQVTIDLDLMQYDSERYHLRDWPRTYIANLLEKLPTRPTW